MYILRDVKPRCEARLGGRGLRFCSETVHTAQPKELGTRGSAGPSPETRAAWRGCRRTERGSRHRQAHCQAGAACGAASPPRAFMLSNGFHFLLCRHQTVEDPLWPKLWSISLAAETLKTAEYLDTELPPPSRTCWLSQVNLAGGFPCGFVRVVSAECFHLTLLNHAPAVPFVHFPLH